jgi:hypothetical protein
MNSLINEPIGNAGVLRQPHGQPLIASAPRLPSLLLAQKAGGDARFAPPRIDMALDSRVELSGFHSSPEELIP